jgi:hypothetical protein
MRRPWWYRAFAALSALWLAVVLAEPAALHSCPMHDAAFHAAGHGATDHHAPAHRTSAEHRSRPDAPAHPGGALHCTCHGDCSATGQGSALPAAVTVAPAASVRVVRATTTVASAAAPRAAEHLLPFANGPPGAGRLG